MPFLRQTLKNSECEETLREIFRHRRVDISRPRHDGPRIDDFVPNRPSRAQILTESSCYGLIETQHDTRTEIFF